MTDSTTRAAAARDLGDGFFGVWVPFEHKDRAKSLPDARWDKNLKCWRVPCIFREEMTNLVAQLNDSADVNMATSTTLVPLLERLFEQVPQRLRTPTFRALAKCWHPDRGGDERLMQQLNELEVVS